MGSCILESTPMYYNLNKGSVQTLKSVYNLDINYTGSLKFGEHASSITSKSRGLIVLIKKIFLATEAKLTLYKIFIRHSLEYCSFIFSNPSTTHKMRVEDVQRSFTCRLLLCDSTLNYIGKYRNLSLEPLCQCRLRSILIFLYKAIYGHSFLTSYLTIIHDPVYRLGNYAYTLLTVKHRVLMSCKFFTLLYSLLWKRSPIPVRNGDTITKFERLKAILLDSKEPHQLFHKLPHSSEALYYEPPYI